MSEGHEVHHDEPSTFTAPAPVKSLAIGLMALGGVGFGLSWIGGANMAWSGWLIGSWIALGFALFGIFFIASTSLANGAWPAVLKRVPEAMTRYFPVAALTIGGVAIGLLTSHLYEWTHPELLEGEHRHLVDGKSAWLNTPWWLIRTVIYFAIWIGFSWMIVGLSRKQDADGNVKHTFTTKKLSAVFCFFFALTVSAASIDYIKSIEPVWFSTMFGPYQFAGIFESGWAMLAILLILLRKNGYLKNVVNENHFHNLGQWLVASSTFWAYLWFCQFMLIWYSNIPEETQHYFARWEGPWFWVTFVVNPILNWVIPFLVLLPRSNKRNIRLVGIVSVIVLIGRFVDLWQFVLPRPHAGHDGPVAHYLPLESFGLVFVAAGFVGAFIFVVMKALEKAPLLAKKDPFYEESLHHHL